MSGACPSCGATLDGAYCAQCGQRAPRPGDFTVRSFLGAAARELGDGDSRSWRTLRHTLVPGVLTRAFLDHAWRRYLPPLRWYLILSGVFFLLAWDVYFPLQVEQLRQLPQVPEELRSALQEPRIAASASDWTALLRFVGVLLMALWVALWQWRRAPLGAHLVFATHYYCADYLLFTLAAPAVALLTRWDLAQVRDPLLLVLLLLLGAWAVLGVRRVYARGWPAALLAGAALLAMDIVLSNLAHSLGMGIAVGIAAAG